MKKLEIVFLFFFLMAISMIGYNGITGYVARSSSEGTSPELDMKWKCDREERTGYCQFSCRGVVYNTGGTAHNVIVQIFAKDKKGFVVENAEESIGTVGYLETKDFSTGFASSCKEVDSFDHTIIYYNR